MHFSAQKTPLLPPEIALSDVTLPTVLPNDVAALKALLHEQHAAHNAAFESVQRQTYDAIARQAQEYIARMIEQMVLARHRQFGVSSEQLSAQARLFDEAETLAQTTTDAQDIATIPAETTPAPKDSDQPAAKPRGKRSPLPAELKRVEVVHDGKGSINPNLFSAPSQWLNLPHGNSTATTRQHPQRFSPLATPA